MEHLAEHPYAFVKDGIVVNICTFAEHDDELPSLLAQAQGADEAIDCCAHGIALMGGTWDGIEFRPIQPFDSWLWDDELKSWVAPSPMPEGRYYWDEDTVSWNEAVDVNP